MAQRPKEEMRRAIVRAAAEELAEVGFERATLANIAARGGTSIGNLYKYFANKDELFSAAVPPDITTELGLRLRARVEALGVERDVRALDDAHPYAKARDDLFDFVVAHRPQVLFLLEKSAGTPYASVAEDLVHALTKLATDYMRRTYPQATLTASRRRALLRVYRAFVGSIASILREERSERALREATAHYTTFHLAGLKAFFESACDTDVV